MNSRAVRDVLAALLGGSAAAVGLLLSTSLPVTMSIAAGVLISATLLIADIMIFKRPLEGSTPDGKKVVATFSAVAVVAALAVSFDAGRLVEQRTKSQAYLHVALGGANPYSGIYSLPTDDSLRDIVDVGDQVGVVCAVAHEHGSWLRLASGRGWVKATEFAPAPHTGLGPPPPCPD